MAFEDLGLALRVVVSGVELTVDVLRAVTSIEVDLARDIADSIKIGIANPSSDTLGRGYAGGEFVFIDSKIWMPGNHVDVYVGYGTEPVHVGSGIIQKWLPVFPSNGVPSLDIAALDGSTRLMDASTSMEPASYPEFDIDTIVLSILQKHDIDVGEVSALPGTFEAQVTKKAGMTDYQFVKGLANLTGFEFKVRYDPTKKRWKGYFRPPTSDQAKKFTFEYMNGVSTLLDFKPNWGLRDAPSEVKVLYFNKSSRTWEEISSKDASTSMKDLLMGKTKAKQSDEELRLAEIDERLRQGLDSLEKIRIGTGDTCVEIQAQRPFASREEAERFAIRWLRDHRDNFITGEGMIIGLEELKPGDVHGLAGLGLVLDGDWEFTSVRHNINVESGFTTTFFANKVLGA